MDPMTYGSAFTADTGLGVSNNLWGQGGGCPRSQIRDGNRRGVYVDIDYTDIILAGTQTTQINCFNGFSWFNTGAAVNAGVSAVNSVEMMGGFLATPTDTDNDSASFKQNSPCFLLSGSETTSGKLWLEHRLCFSPILTNGIGWILGLAETDLFTLATAVPLNASDAVTADGAFIGFNKLEDGLGVINTCRADRAAAAPTSIQAAVSSVAGFEFVKLGMFYDPSNVTECVQFFVNGIKQTTVLTRAALQAFTYIDANALGFLFAVVADSAGTTANVVHDWTRIYQLAP